MVIFRGIHGPVSRKDELSMTENSSKLGRHEWILCILGLVIFLADAAFAQQDMEIGQLVVTGNRILSTSTLLNKVRSRAGQFFDAATAAEDARRVAQVQGVEYCYYNTQVIDGKIRLTFVVLERSVAGQINFSGNKSLQDTTLEKKLAIKRGDYVDAIAAKADVETLTEYYQKKGFAFAKVRADFEKIEQGQVNFTIDEGPRVRIAAVKYEGNKAVKSQDLAKAVKTGTSKWLILANYYDEKKVAGDVSKLQDIYQRKGYLDAAVEARPLFSDRKDKVDITFVIDEGHLYTIERIELVGSEYFTNEQLLGQLQSKAGQVYKNRQAQADARRLAKMYLENGFIDAKVSHSRLFVSEGSVDARFEISEGQRFRIGRVNISGNTQTQDKVIRRILDEHDFTPGQWYNADTARGDGRGFLEKKIQRQLLAEASSITAGGTATGHRDAEVTVVEGQTGAVIVGAGVASDSGLIGQLVFRQSNFDISDKPESFEEFITGQAFKGAGQELDISLMPGTEVSSYSINFTDPYWRDQPISLNVTGLSYERWRESYDENRTKGYFGFEKRYKNDWRRSIGFRAENVNIDDIDTDAPKEITDVKGDNVLLGVTFGAGKDTTDFDFNPTEGYRVNVTYEQVAGDHTFGIVSGVYTRYKTIREDLAERKTVLATKLYAGSTVGDAPAFEKFYAGGQTTLRGFEYRGVSTRGLQQKVFNPERKDPVGSDWLVLANAEVIMPLTGENLSWLLFVDSGLIDSGGYRAAIGTGLQIEIPQWFGRMPMRLELAVPLLKEDGDDTQVFSFSVGRLF